MIVKCEECGGSGETTHHEDDQPVTQECAQCDGHGAITVDDRSGEPEDYEEQES